MAKLNINELKNKLLHHPNGIDINDKVVQILINSKSIVSKIEDGRSYLDELSTSHPLIKTAKNEWHILEGAAGSGGFGAVNFSSLKIIIEDGKGKLVHTDDVIKAQTLPKDPRERTQKIADIRKEVKNQAEHQVRVGSNLIIDNDTAYIVLENCGLNLERYLEKYNPDFDARMRLALAIATEMGILRKNDTIHADIKPANMCVKDTGRGLAVRFIDFGFAEKAHSKTSTRGIGTPLYMAPESLRSNASYETDFWAFGAVLGELFNAKTMFASREKNYAQFMANKTEKNFQNFLNTTYDYDSLFTGIAIPQNVDQQLLEDFKTLLNDYQSKDPTKRPNLDFFTRFRVLMDARRAHYENVLAVKEEIRQKLEQIEQEFSEIIGFEQNNSSIFETYKTIESQIHQDISKNPRSHLDITKEMIANNKSSNQYPDAFNYENLCDSLTMLDNNLESINHFKENYQTILNELSHPQLQKSNSSGFKIIREIQENNKLSPVEKLKKLKELGQSKLQPGFRNSYCRFSFFLKKGRHENVELLYKKLANLNLNEPKLTQFNYQLDQLNLFIKGSNFLHSNSQDTCELSPKG